MCTPIPEMPGSYHLCDDEACEVWDRIVYAAECANERMLEL